MTWVEIGVLLLIGERGFAIACGFLAGARAAWRASRPRVESAPPAPNCTLFAEPTTTGFPAAVEIESDDAVSLDYSSGSKRH
jgi:hypothetical protein